MTKEELQNRIQKKKEDIARMERNLKKYVVDEQFTRICNQYFADGDRTALNAWRVEHHMSWLPEYYSKASDLNEARKTLAKYETQLNALVNYENETKIEVIWNFLLDWKQKAYNWYVKNAEHYIFLRSEYSTKLSQYRESHLEEFKKRYGDRWAESYLRDSFHHQYYSNISEFTKSIVECGEINYSKLEKFLNEELDRKYKDMVFRVTKITGEIIDAQNLRISVGDINGIIVGQKAKATINTISAGGYNIQCFHYRVLVKEVK